MFCQNQDDLLRVGVCTFLFTVVNLVMCSITMETFGSSIKLANVHVSVASQELSPPRAIFISEVTSSSMVGTIMALLATFDEAGVLPHEGTAQANQVIHGLIQLQSALMKSESPELAAYWMAAKAHWTSQDKEIQDGVLGGKGLTARVLAALILYDQEHHLWKDQRIVSAVQAFNVTHADWILIVDLFHKANAVFRKQGRSIHRVYDAWRMNMPGGKS